MSISASVNESCSNHPGRDASNRCDHCAKPVCKTCVVKDIGMEQDLCSTQCMKNARAAHPYGSRIKSNLELSWGLDSPFFQGWADWGRSCLQIAIRTAPVALLAAFFILTFLEMTETGLPEEEESAYLPNWVWAVVAVLGAYGFALTAVLFSQRYTRRIQGDVYLLALKRLIPWLATLAIATAASFVGFMLLVLPGIYIAIRLFWADEFALAFGYGPIRALSASWKLTEHDFGSVFWFQLRAGWATYPVLLLVFGAFVVIGLAVGFLAEALSISLSLVLVTLMVAVIFQAYGLLHGPELARFYGKLAKDSSHHLRSGSVLGLN